MFNLFEVVRSANITKRYHTVSQYVSTSERCYMVSPT
jgi:hypothetical protein